MLRKKIANRLNRLRNYVKCLTGLNKLNERVDTLYFYLNKYVDITKLPPTDDEDLRNLQLCDATLLAIFDRLCQKHHISYWMDFGTLLGAVRHKGFIPWDNDIDITLPRVDYEKTLELFPKELARYGIEYKEIGMMQRIGLSIQKENTGIWIDVFPIDEYRSVGKCSEVRGALVDKMLKYRRYYLRHCRKSTWQEMTDAKKRIVGEGSGNNTILWQNVEFRHDGIYLFDYDEIFPLRQISFEGYMLNAPNRTEDVLNQEIHNYMSFPKSGLFHHQHLKGLATASGISLKEIRKKLELAIVDLTIGRYDKAEINK